MALLSDPNMDNVDFYTLLSIPPTANESEIRRAYRKTSRLYHPDKVTPTPETLEKFQQLQRAIDVLTDAAERTKYDSQREAKQRRAAETAALDSRRRKMKEDLEMRERNGNANGVGGVGVVNGVKRTWTDRELEIKRIAEENRRRMEDVKMKKLQELRKMEEDAAAAAVNREGVNGEQDGAAGEAIERSVKVRWIKEGDGLDIDSDALVEMFPAGEVEDAVILKDKKRKVEGKGKVVLGTAVLVFRSLVAAKKAVAKGKTDELESVSWAMDSKDKKSEPT